jgi:transcriptional regulator with XRE-family HTH domain
MDIGARLRQAREHRGLTIDALSKSTRVQPRILAAIERNDTVSLPPRPYGRGFVRAYASEVGLDPDGTVREFFSQFAPTEDVPMAVEHQPAPERAAPERRWIWPVGAVVGYAAVGALVIIAGQWALQKSGEAGAVGTTGAAIPAATSGVERQTAPAPPPARAGVAILLDAQRPAWVTASVDGQRALYRTLQPGERVSLKGTREINIRTGDAGALLWQVNGRPAVPMGAPGEVRTARVTPDQAPQIP